MTFSQMFPAAHHREGFGGVDRHCARLLARATGMGPAARVLRWPQPPPTRCPCQVVPPRSKEERFLFAVFMSVPATRHPTKAAVVRGGACDGRPCHLADRSLCIVRLTRQVRSPLSKYFTVSARMKLTDQPRLHPRGRSGQRREFRVTLLSLAIHSARVCDGGCRDVVQSSTHGLVAVMDGVSPRNRGGGAASEGP
jgi:hypothetical protein